MNISSKKIILNSFLQKCDPKEKKELLEYLIPNEKEILEGLPPLKIDIINEIQTTKDLLGPIHPSWFTPYLRTLSKKEISLFITILTPNQSQFLIQTLFYSGHFPKISVLGEEYLRKILIQYLTQDLPDLLPLALLPDSPLKTLTELNNDQLAQLVDLLGLHDLSIELFQIVEKNKLQKVHDILTAQQKKYLKHCLQNRDLVAFRPMGINRWNGDQDKLKTLIQQRGTNRLAKALYDQNPSLNWYILHILDIERATLVKKLILPLDSPQAHQKLVEEVIDLTIFIKDYHE